MYWPPDLQHKVVKQRQQELIEQAERERLFAGVRPVPLPVRLKAAWDTSIRILLRPSFGHRSEAAAPSTARRTR